MTWNAPMTAVSNTAFTAAQFNTNVRDNLLETAPAKATASGQVFVATGTNAIAARSPAGATVAASQTTASVTYADLTTVGPSVTVTTGTAAYVAIQCRMANGTANSQCYASWSVSGATTVAASNTTAIICENATAGNIQRHGVFHYQSGLNPGSNTFTMQYHTDVGTGTFSDRHIAVIPL
jgi:hypothetical protein